MAESYIFGSIDRLFTLAQLNLLILLMLSIQQSSTIGCFALLLILFWHTFSRIFVLHKIIKFSPESPILNIKARIKYSSLLASYKYSADPKTACIQPALLLLHNVFLAIILVFYNTGSASKQAFWIVGIMMAYLLYLALYQPMQNKIDNAMAILSRVVLLGALMEHARPFLV